MGQWRCIAFTKQHIAEQVHQRIPLGPGEIAVRDFIVGIAEIQQEGRNRVRHRRAFRTQHLVRADLHAFDLHHVRKIRRITHIDFQEQYRRIRGYMIVFALLLFLQGILLFVTRLALVGNNAERAPLSRLVEPVLCDRIDLEAFHPEFGGAVDA